MTRKQFWLINAWSLIVLSACNSEPKDGLADTYASGVIVIAASENFQPIVQKEIDVFERLFPLAGIVPCYTTEVDAINQFPKGSVRLVIATHTLTPEEMDSFHSRKLSPREIKLATDGLALIVSRQNTNTLISVRDIRRILMRRIHAWKKLYPTSKLDDTQLVFGSENSSTIRLTIDSICKRAPLSDKDAKALRTNQQVIDHVARTSDAIGVISVNWLRNRGSTTNLSFRDEIRVMSINVDDTATPQNSYKSHQAYLYYGSYPLAHLIYVLLNDPCNALPRGFASFLISDRGQWIILKSGLVSTIQPVRIVDVKDK